MEGRRYSIGVRNHSGVLRLMAGAAICCAVLLGGCGTGVPVVVTPPVAPASKIAGNWLLFGAFPKAVESPTTQPGMAISFDAVGNNLVASAAISTTCGAMGLSFGARFGAAVTGTVASDGSFTVSSLNPGGTTNITTLSVSGNVPTTAGASWSGTYALVASEPGCSFSQTGLFTATAVQDVNGTYAGTGTVLVASGTAIPANTPVTVSVALQQGAPLYTPFGTTTSSRVGLKGSIQISGFSCFSKGNSSTSAASEVVGGPLSANFVMDDGSTLMMVGSIDDVATSRLDVDFFQVNGGSCSGFYSFGINPMVVQRQ